MEKAILNVDTLYISQKMNGTYSHNGDLAIDISKLTYLKAPFTGVIKKIYHQCNGVWLESIDKVEYADGTKDYMTIMTLHANNISNLYVGKIIKQGEIYYYPGTKGISTGNHIHIAVGKGKFKGTGWYKGKYQPKVKAYAWLIYNQYDITRALFLSTTTNTKKSIYNWLTINDQKYSIEEIAKEVINGKWGNGKTRISRLTQAGYDYKIIQNKVNEILQNKKQNDINNNITYVVVKGDYLIKIGKKFNVNWRKIAHDNNIKFPYILKIGQQITINKSN